VMMVSWWASHFGCHPVQQWKVSRLVAWCKLEVCGAFMMDWDIGRGCGRDALWVYWLGCMAGPPVGGLLGWRVDGRLIGWIASWRFGRFAGGQTGRSLVGKEVDGLRGLQLLATTVSSPHHHR